MKKIDLIQAQAKQFRKPPAEVRFLKAMMVGLTVTLAFSFGVLLAILEVI